MRTHELSLTFRAPLTVNSLVGSLPAFRAPDPVYLCVIAAPVTTKMFRPSKRGDAEAIHIAALLFLLACARCLAHQTLPHRAFDNVEPALLA